MWPELHRVRESEREEMPEREEKINGMSFPSSEEPGHLHFIQCLW